MDVIFFHNEIMIVHSFINIYIYDKILENTSHYLKKNNGVTDLSFRKKMACKIYKGTSSYDKIISDWLNETQK